MNEQDQRILTDEDRVSCASCLNQLLGTVCTRYRSPYDFNLSSQWRCGPVSGEVTVIDLKKNPPNKNCPRRTFILEGIKKGKIILRGN